MLFSPDHGNELLDILDNLCNIIQQLVPIHGLDFDFIPTDRTAFRIPLLTVKAEVMSAGDYGDGLGQRVVAEIALEGWDQAGVEASQLLGFAPDVLQLRRVLIGSLQRLLKALDLSLD